MAKESKGEQTGFRLRRAAIDVFAREGFQRTRISDIVAAAKVSQPAFYMHYDSKDAAYDALVNEFRENLGSVIRASLIAAETPRSRLTDRVALSFEQFLTFMATDTALTEIGFFQPPGCSETKAQLVAWFAVNVEQEQQRGLYRTDIAPEQIARMLVGLLDQMGRNIDGADLGALSRDCAKLFCGGALHHET